jgi:hypothetical protein
VHAHACCKGHGTRRCHNALSEADDAAVVTIEHFAQLLRVVVVLEVEELDELLVGNLHAEEEEE